MRAQKSNVIVQLPFFESTASIVGRKKMYFLFDSLLTFLSVNYFVEGNISFERNKSKPAKHIIMFFYFSFEIYYINPLRVYYCYDANPVTGITVPIIYF